MKIKLPTQLRLLALREYWKIDYETIKKKHSRIIAIGPYHLLVQTPYMSRKHCLKPIEAWLKKKAKIHFEQRLSSLSLGMGVNYKNINIRGQRARWGSCSEHKNISLNYKLLFLPSAWVHYILVHEMSHLKYLDHSPRFWKFVEKHHIDFEQKRHLIDKHGHIYVPSWTDHRR